MRVASVVVVVAVVAEATVEVTRGYTAEDIRKKIHLRKYYPSLYTSPGPHEGCGEQVKMVKNKKAEMLS